MGILEGQNRLNIWFDNLTIKNLPKTFLFCGDLGCGKHTLEKAVADKLNLKFQDITMDLSKELITHISYNNIPTLYLVNLNALKKDDQNILLKWTEEPTDATYICLLSDNYYRVLPTILNRCIKYDFEQYPQEILQKYIDAEISPENSFLALKVFSTIGQIKMLRNQNLVGLKELCDKLITMMEKANIQNALSVSNKFNYSDEYEKYDIELFFRMLAESGVELSIKDADRYLKYYQIINKYWSQLSYNPKLNKQYVIEGLLVSLWKKSRGLL